MPSFDSTPERLPEVGSASYITGRCASAGVLGILAAWIGADSIGIIAEPLRIILTCAVLVVVVLLARPSFRPSIVLLPAGMFGIRMVAIAPAELELLLTVAVFALLATVVRANHGAMFFTCAGAALSLAVYQIAWRSCPLVWRSSEFASEHLTRLVGKPCDVGTTFAGLDFLILAGAFTLIWLARTEPPLRQRAFMACTVIFAGHWLYLTLLSHSFEWKAALPATPEPAFQHPYVPPPWDWTSFVSDLLPWNVPLLAAGIHVFILFFLIRWSAWLPAPRRMAPLTGGAPLGRLGSWLASDRIACLCAVLLAATATLDLPGSQHSLAGKSVLAGGQGRLDWQTPQHDSYGQASAGMFGMLPHYVQSLGGQFAISDALADDDLAEADLLLLLHPTSPMPEDRLQRIWRFVRGGGSLLIAAEPYYYEAGVESCFNQILEPTSIRVRQDVAISETGNWLHALRPIAHSVSAGLRERVRTPFTDSGSSLAVRFPAYPLVVGRWGWSDPGSEAVATGVYRLDRGERLGDVVLLAEQRLGRGRVAVLGDSTCLTNEGMVHSYEFTGRLLSDLAAGRTGSPQLAWRQLITLTLAILVLAIALYRSRPTRVAAMAFCLALSLAVCDRVNRTSAVCIPGASTESQINSTDWQGIAYIESSHLQAFNDSDWGYDATNGLALTLIRNRYLTFRLPEMTADRLRDAKLVVSMAPARRYTRNEQRLVEQFVRNGGIWVSAVGAEQASASEDLLASFGLNVPRSPVPTVSRAAEPAPMGRFRSLFLDARDYGAGDYKAGVTFHAGWPVEHQSKDTEVLVYGLGDQPIVVCRHLERGKFVLIGDTGFAMNKNLEYIGGEPFDHGYENAHFWRWLISRLSGSEEWVPPAPNADATAGNDAES